MASSNENSVYLRLGTSSFTAEGWEKTFYPKGMQARDYLSYYATQFDTLEIDATFLPHPGRIHGERLVCQDAREFPVRAEGPAGNHGTNASLSMPNRSLKEFLRVTDHLGEKRGPILFQFHTSTRRLSPRRRIFWRG